MDFAQRLKDERARIGCTNAELCEILFGLDGSTLKGWLVRKRVPDPIKQELVIYRLQQEPPKKPIIRSYKDLKRPPT